MFACSRVGENYGGNSTWKENETLSYPPTHPPQTPENETALTQLCQRVPF